jgi:hypothetical protein
VQFSNTVNLILTFSSSVIYSTAIVYCVSNLKENPRQYEENELFFISFRATPSAILDGIETAALRI